jgi:phospholipid/cholesterol/gamma-HCH transport system ATP-binding protein
VIELAGVYKAFGEKRVLRGLDLSIEPGETFVVLGRSGTGKSVTLKTIVGLLRPDRGEITVDGIDVIRADMRALREVRREVAYLFQTGALVNWMTIRENVALPLIERRRIKRKDIRRKVEESLASLDLLESADLLPEQISGGMRKRAALCRVLVQEPKVILYDEPTAGLDPILSRTVAGMIREVQERSDRTALVVTHDLELAFAVADRIGLHHDGRLVEVADPERFRQSRHPVVRSFLDGDADNPDGDRG